jgi:hypothetical protein
LNFLASSKSGEFWSIFSMKIPLHRSKFGENLPAKEMLTQSMRQNLTVSQNKSRLPGRTGEDVMPSVCSSYLHFLFLQIKKKSNFVG